MLERFFFLFLAAAFIGLIFYIYHLKKQIRRLKNLSHFYYQISAMMGLMTVSYDVRGDVLTLSPDCARLLHLPELIRHYSGEQQDAHKDASHPLHAIDLCLSSFSEETPWSYLQRGEAPRRFMLRSYILKDEAGRPYYLLGIFRDITKQSNEEARLAMQAQFDGLTRIHNSGATRSWMRAHIGIPRADGQRGGMLFLLDVDHFKQVNDTLGHQGGDRALICVANALRQAFAGRGFLGRLGGDEFIAYLAETDIETAERIARAIHEHVLRLGHEAGLSIDLTVSIGCAILDAEDYEAAYKKADRALYAAKEKGRNTHVICAVDGVEIPPQQGRDR